MTFEIVGTTLLVEDLTTDEVFTIGPYEDENDELGFAKLALEQLRPSDTLTKPHETPDRLQDETNLAYKEAYLVAFDSDGKLTACVWQLDHRE